MKKLLIISIFFFSTIFFIDNVSAETINFDFGTKNYNSALNVSNEDIYNYYLQYYSNDYKYYYIAKPPYFNTAYIYLWNSEDIKLGLTTRYYNNNPAFWFYIYIPSNIEYRKIEFSNNANLNVTSNTIYTETSNKYIDTTWWTGGAYALENLNTNYSIDLFMKTNKDFVFLDYNLNAFDNIYYSINQKQYNINDTIDFIPVDKEIIPTISISKESETTVTIDSETFISSVTLNIDFSTIDNEKYLYMYKYGINSEWSTITLSNSTSLSLTYNYNDTLYSQVVDRETNEVVSSTTYTVNSINYNFMPYVDVTENTPSSCFFYKNGRSYTICKDINIVAKNLQDGNFIASYSYDTNSWVNFENTTISLNENTIIYFRITNYLTNEVSYISTYNVSSIDTDISDLGVFNTYSSTYNKDTSFITAYINIYNLIEPIQDNYKIYYSTNSTSFIDITLLLTDMTNYYQYEINNINENKTIYFKITDLNDNILYTSNYSINYQIQANENSNFFTSFRTNFYGLSDIISTPLYAIKKLNTGVCSPLEIPIPYTNTTISLPCMTTIYQNNIPDILNIWQIVTNGIISYYIILDLFRIVKSFKEPEEDKIEVVDL